LLVGAPRAGGGGAPPPPPRAPKMRIAEELRNRGLDALPEQF
jgi:hypothetical protein